MAVDLSVTIGADSKPLSDGLNKASGDVKAFAATTDNSLSKLSGTLSGTLPRASNQAGFALQNLGRVAQDAPFGFIGIQNNLNPLLESFQALKRESGSTGGALKALAGSLIGAGGIGLALSVVSSAFLLYQDYQRKATNGAESLSKANKDNADSFNSLANSAASETAKLSVLYEASQNLNIPLSNRKKLVDELQNQYPAYFANLKDEEILAGKAANAYKTLTQDLINAAVARGGEELIAKQTKKLAELAISLNLASIKAKDLTAAQREVAASGVNGFLIDETGDSQLQSISEYRTKLEKEIRDTQKAVQSIIGGFSIGSILGDFGIDKEPKTKKPKAIKNERFDEIKKQMVDLRTQLNLEGDQINTINLIPFEKGLADIAGRMPGYVGSMVATLNQFSNDASQIVEFGIGDAFAGIGDAIGTAFSEGTSLAEGLGKSLLSSLGSVLGQLGQMSIATGVAILGIKVALKTLNPFAAIAGGVALLALSGVVKGAAAKLGGGMGSGGNNSGSPATGSLNTGSVNTGSNNGGFNGGTVVFEISGTKLLGVLQATTGRNLRIG